MSPVAPWLAVCGASIRAEMPGDVASFARPWRGKRRVCERHKRLLTDQLPSSTHADTLHDCRLLPISQLDLPEGICYTRSPQAWPRHAGCRGETAVLLNA